MTNKKIFLIVFSLFFSIAVTALLVNREKLVYLLPAKEPQVLRDLAYDKDKRLGYTVHIKEDGKLVPYLVLAKNYIGQGNVLLLRKHLVDPPMSFERAGRKLITGIAYQMPLCTKTLSSVCLKMSKKIFLLQSWG